MAGGGSPATGAWYAACSGPAKDEPVDPRRWLIAALVLSCAACAPSLPTTEEANEALDLLRTYGPWAWLAAIVLICADLVLPVPQATIIAALGVLYGTAIGGVVGAVGQIAAGALGYGLMWTSARHLVRRLVGVEALARMQRLFDQSGAWAIVLTRSLPYSVPEALVCLAGIAAMPVAQFFGALALGSIPTAFVYAGIGSLWADRPLLVLLVSWALPIALLPVVLLALRSPASRHSGANAAE
jgi:uncharacterized membrane protein YdjX (TVP38/TMEM64 family)